MDPHHLEALLVDTHHPDALHLDALPFALHRQGPTSPRPPKVESGVLHLAAGAGADLYRDPRGSSGAPDAERLVGEVSGDFQLSARVTARYAATFDSAVLLGWVDDRTWFKICAERDAAGTPRVVSVVTRGTSDDADGWAVDPQGVHLRISRTGSAFALHAYDDGARWQFVRLFTLGTDPQAPLRVGFLAQSPTGEGTEAQFSDIRFTRNALVEVRDGS